MISRRLASRSAYLETRSWTRKRVLNCLASRSGTLESRSRRQNIVPRALHRVPRHLDIVPRRSDMLPRRWNLISRQNDSMSRRENIVPLRTNIASVRWDIAPPPRANIVTRAGDATRARRVANRVTAKPPRLSENLAFAVGLTRKPPASSSPLRAISYWTLS